MTKGRTKMERGAWDMPRYHMGGMSADQFELFWILGIFRARDTLLRTTERSRAPHAGFRTVLVQPRIGFCTEMIGAQKNSSG